MNSRITAWIASSIAVALLAPVAGAQTVLHRFDVAPAAVAGAGDVDGDGSDDVILGLEVYSGADGRRLLALPPGGAFDQRGSAVAGAGDVDGDGLADVLIGAPAETVFFNRDGAARVFAGADGSLLWRFTGGTINTRFGAALSGVGDVDQDGFDDVIVGAPDESTSGGEGNGTATVFSGFDGASLYRLIGNHTSIGGGSFGASVSGAGDVNGDGHPDFIVGAPSDDEIAFRAGTAQVFSGLDGSRLYVFGGRSAHASFGFSVSGAGDVNGDGFGDVIVGAPREDIGGRDFGSVHVFSGADGTQLYEFVGAAGNDRFGENVSGAGDFDGDGFDDFAIGARLDDTGGRGTGRVWVHSGADGSLLFSRSGAPNEGLGGALAAAGDVNGDGLGDIVAGSQAQVLVLGRAAACDPEAGDVCCRPVQVSLGGAERTDLGRFGRGSAAYFAELALDPDERAFTLTSADGTLLTGTYTVRGRKCRRFRLTPDPTFLDAFLHALAVRASLFAEPDLELSVRRTPKFELKLKQNARRTRGKLRIKAKLEATTEDAAARVERGSYAARLRVPR